MIFQTQARAPAERTTSTARPLLQRKCACGGKSECPDCEGKLAINQPNDRFEREADQVAEHVMSGNGGGAGKLSVAPNESVQRDENEKKTPPKPNNYGDAAKKIGDALQETPIGKQLKAKAEELGKDFLSSVEGKVIAGTSLAGALTAIIATDSKLPIPIPEVPLDFIKPGLKAKLTYEGPTQKPTNVGLTLTSKSGVSISAAYTKTAATPGKPAEEKAGLTLSFPLGGSPSNKKTTSDADQRAAEIAQLRAEKAQRDEERKTPGEKKADEDFMKSYLHFKANDPLNPLNIGKKKDDLLLMRSAAAEAVSGTAPPIVHDTLAGGGQPLDRETRSFMEERFGHDFGRVRIHNDARAAESARAVNAHAYTVGAQIAFDTARYSPTTAEGRRLLAHELTHVVQQEQLPPEKTSHVFRSATTATHGQSQGTGPQSVSLSTGTKIVHTPACGAQTITATVAPSGLTGVTWSLHDDGTTVDARSSIDSAGAITLGSAQTGGTIRIRATDSSGGSADIQLILSSHPTDIDSTTALGPPPDARNNYGGTFDHVFKSSDGKVESLERVGVGERFPNVPTPDAATHAITNTPFGNGTFTLTTATLTPDASNNWFLTKAGGLNGTHDRVSIGRAGIDVGQHIASTSNPKPANPLPAGFSVQQDLNWYCPAAAADKRWTKFKSIDHERRLRLDSSGDPEFVAIVNKVERTDTYTGTTGVQKATATPATIVKSPEKEKANTVQISATALPSTRKLHFSLQGNANGCSINSSTGLLTIGKTAGTVTARAANASGGTNYDEVAIAVTDPPAPKTPAPGAPTNPPAGKTATEGLPNESEPTTGESRGFSAQASKAPNESSHRLVVPRLTREVLSEKGQPLDSDTRAFMEPRFHHSFAAVQVHTDAKAAASARAVNAKAYTVGRHVVFGANEYRPATPAGRELLAHELAHTVQQRNGDHSASSTYESGVSESSAQATGSAVSAGHSLTTDLPASSVRLARTPDNLSEADKKKLAEQVERGIEIAQSMLGGLASNDDDAGENEPIAPTPMAIDPRYSKGAKPSAPAPAKKTPIKPKPAPSIFDPGGFTPEVADKLVKEAEVRTHLGTLAMDLAEKQARRREFFDRDPSHTNANVIEAAGLDLYWDEANQDWRRQSYVDAVEAPIDTDPELHQIYGSHLWDLENNKPVEESRFHAAMSFVCQHTNPCNGNMEQFHKDLESGMSREEALNRGMFRIVGQSAEMAVPGKADLVEVEGPNVPMPEVTAPEEAAPASAEPSRQTIKASPPPPPTQAQRPGAPEPVTDVDVVKTNVDRPASVKTQSPTAHQTDWTARGGSGKAPPAYRDSEGNVHVSTEHPLMGDPRRGGVPPVRPEGKSPAAPVPPRTQQPAPPLKGTKSGDNIGLEDTGKVPPPAKPAVDPKAKTQVPPPQEKPVPKGAATGGAAEESKREQAPRGQIDPPQAVSREVVENMRNRPKTVDPKRKGSGSNVHYTTDHAAHEQAWKRVGGHGDSPPAFIYDNQVYLDPSRWN